MLDENMPENIKPWLTKSQTENLTRNEISEGEKEYFSPIDIEDEEESERFYPELIPAEELLTSANSRDDIYFSYANAISRRGREPLSQGRFEAHFWGGASYDRPLAYGDEQNGYLLGAVNELGIFTPTHFAPFSMRGGYELFKKLGESALTPSILAITDDLVETLQKMPCWHTLELPEAIMAGFHSGEIFEKKLMYNDYFETSAGRELAGRAFDVYFND